MDYEQVTARGGSCSVRVSGPDSRHTVLLLPGVGDPPSIFDGVVERLHNSDLKTIVIEDISGLTYTDVVEVLDELSLPWVHLVGSKGGAELAWLLAARTFGRITSLVVCDRAHPGVADDNGTVLDDGCPPVELPTTLMIGSSLQRASADRSSRLVYGDFRIVQLDGVADIPSGATAELATEAVLRTSPW